MAGKPVVIPNPTGAVGSAAFRDLLLPFAFLAGSLLWFLLWEGVLLVLLLVS